MSALVRYVDATFDGKKRRFELKRSRIEAFEKRLRWSASEHDVEMGASAYAAMRRFHKGGWTAADIEQTLAFAGETQTATQATAERIERHAAQHGMAMTGMATGKPLKVMPAIERDGHAAYASLAETILRAALFGITPEEADFDNYEEAA